MGGGEKGRVDLLLKFFDSQTHFNSWVALTYLYKSTSSPGVTDYLCNRLYTLPEEQVEVYLSQLCQLIVNRPNSPLERVVVDLCARSLRVAVKVGSLQRGSCIYVGQRGVLLETLLRAYTGVACKLLCAP